ncbi:MAG TPA: STAS domain-containing protein [Actinomycetota bacterium]
MKHELLSAVSEQRGHVAYLGLSGEIDIATAPALEGWLRAAESNGNTAIVVDLEAVTFMDVSGLRAFLGAAERARGSRRTFGIARAPAIVQRVFQITGTTHLLAEDAHAFFPNRTTEDASA